ncbi:hypothetical protein AVEN_135024-1 [Araneus ventricosus]|uniref:Uncharacterized protein n=1 Tax=Araneus ventricosus TaxID=182803 RepID=A0A4Y2UYB3_ARAVE|nr:hypothetical protein AVEN_135024-1 [Araneus ventricosus]
MRFKESKLKCPWKKGRPVTAPEEQTRILRRVISLDAKPEAMERSEPETATKLGRTLYYWEETKPCSLHSSEVTILISIPGLHNITLYNKTSGTFNL